MAKSAVKSVFSLDPLPVISPPKPPFFIHFGRFWSKNHLFRGVFLFDTLDFLARNLILHRKNQFDGVCFRPKHLNFDFCRRRKEESRRFFSPPPLHSKNTSRLSLKTSPLFATSSLVSLKTSLPRHQLPFNPTRRTRAYAHIRARALSEFAIFAFTLHLTPQQAVYQSVEGEGKPCIHLHRNNLKNNTLHDIRCKKSVKAKG